MGDLSVLKDVLFPDAVGMVLDGLSEVSGRQMYGRGSFQLLRTRVLL